MATYAVGPAIFGMSISLSILGVLAVAGRFFIRGFYGQGYRADDWLMLPALLCTIGQAISIMIGVANHAVGYPDDNPVLVTLDQQFIVVEEVFFAVSLINVLGLMFAKLSILFFYRRVFHTGCNKAFNYTSIALATFIIGWGISYFFSQLFQCGTHISANWALDTLADLVLFIMPIPLIWRLKMSIARRLAVLLIFAIGALTLVTSLIRVVFFVAIYTNAITSSLANQDPVLEFSIFFYWTMLESGLAVIVGCLPTYQVWFKKVTVDTVIKNVRGIFSVQSFSRTSKVSTQEKSRETTSSEASLKHESFEMLSGKEIGVTSEITMIFT